jgi:uncharacterized protein
MKATDVSGLGRNDFGASTIAGGSHPVKRRVGSFFSLLLAACLMAGLASASPAEDAQAAFDQGDFKRAFAIWYPLAEQGQPDAEYGLGRIYTNGYGRAQDYGAALKWFRSALAHGNVDANNGIGFLYVVGGGVPQDDARAAKYFRVAAEHGMATAQFNLAWMYQKGSGVPKDYAEAFYWYKLAADQGLADAQSNLGDMYYKGIGIAADYPKAAELYRLAAEQGLARAEQSLGAFYAYGLGVPRDYVQAHKWLSLSILHTAEASRRNAIKAVRDRCAAKMTAEQIAEATRLAAEWRPRAP